MPTITRTTSGMISPDWATTQNRVNALRASFAAGNVITAAHINELIGMFVQFNDHYHSSSDYAFEAYGNTAPTGSYYAADPRYTSGMYDRDGYYGATGGREPGWADVGGTITASFHEAIRTMYLGANGHYHSIEDVVY